MMTAALLLLLGAIELTVVLTIRPMRNARQKHIATTFFGVLSAVLISVALLPQYYEIYKHKTVIGISLVFLSIDMLGGLLNDLSLVFSDRFDALAAASYTLVIVLDGVVIVCAGVFKFINWKKSRTISSLEPPSNTVSHDSE